MTVHFILISCIRDKIEKMDTSQQTSTKFVISCYITTSFMQCFWETNLSKLISVCHFEFHFVKFSILFYNHDPAICFVLEIAVLKYHKLLQKATKQPFWKLVCSLPGIAEDLSKIKCVGNFFLQTCQQFIELLLFKQKIIAAVLLVDTTLY